MDDMVESFMQSWVVEDVLVDHFRLSDHPHFTNLNEDAEDESGTEATRRSSKRRHHGRTESPIPPPNRQTDQADDEESCSQRRQGGMGNLNFMLSPSGLDVENSDGWMQYQQFDDPMMPDASLPQQSVLRPKVPAPPTASKLGKQQVNHLASNEAQLALDSLSVPDGVQKEPTANGKVPKAKTPRIDLVLDISNEMYHMSESEKGVAKPPNIHWKRRSRLVKEGERRGEYDV